MMRLFVLAACVWLSWLPTNVEARPTFYVELGAVLEAKGASCALVAHGERLLPRLLRAYPQVTTVLKKRPGETLARSLRRARLIGFRIVLRITKCTHRISAPKPGQTFRTARAAVTTAIDAEKIPSGQMALAGVGDAEVEAEVSKSNDKELKSIIYDAFAEATKGAVKKFVSKLHAKKSRKRRGRRRRR